MQANKDYSMGPNANDALGIGSVRRTVSYRNSSIAASNTSRPGRVTDSGSVASG
jgi:hypothetical protein